MHINFYSLRKIGRFIKRIIIWIPILWKQENWDYEYLYDLIEFKLKELRQCLKEDNLHKDSPKCARQISICLEYLYRYRNPYNYIDYPIDDIKFVPCENGCCRMIHTNNLNEIKRKKIFGYENFNYDMFWKRFLQWHLNWWC